MRIEILTLRVYHWDILFKVAVLISNFYNKCLSNYLVIKWACKKGSILCQCNLKSTYPQKISKASWQGTEKKTWLFTGTAYHIWSCVCIQNWYARDKLKKSTSRYDTE